MEANAVQKKKKEEEEKKNDIDYNNIRVVVLLRVNAGWVFLTRVGPHAAAVGVREERIRERESRQSTGNKRTRGEHKSLKTKPVRSRYITK